MEGNEDSLQKKMSPATVADEHDPPPVPQAAESGVHLTYTAATVKALVGMKSAVVSSRLPSLYHLEQQTTHYHTLVAVCTISAMMHTPYTLLWCLAMSIVTCSNNLASGIRLRMPK